VTHMKACSFLPAATRMIFDMQLDHLLYGVTFECPVPIGSSQQKVVRCLLEGNKYSSIDIDKIFSASKASGKSLYYVEEELLQAIEPDIIFTQDVCEVCQIDTACTSAAIEKLNKKPLLVPLSPNNLQDVFHSAITIAESLGHEEAAYKYLNGLNARLANILDTLRKNRMPLKRVMVLEWMDPIYNCGHWIPFQIAQAGGIDMLSNPSGDSIVMDWNKILKYDPEVLVIALCGFNIARSRQEINILLEKAGWNSINAIQNDQVYLADSDLFTQPSASTLVEGIELLAALFHPGLFTPPTSLKNKFLHLSKISAHAFS
ncbi:MAG TPA: ABC transporter substrate-binding protein, partial [Puia sp.]|nr:ABC transporter substrate-binding protein [Puia sp.]